MIIWSWAFIIWREQSRFLRQIPSGHSHHFCRLIVGIRVTQSSSTPINSLVVVQWIKNFVPHWNFTVLHHGLVIIPQAGSVRGRKPIVTLLRVRVKMSLYALHSFALNQPILCVGHARTSALTTEGISTILTSNMFAHFSSWFALELKASIRIPLNIHDTVWPNNRGGKFLCSWRNKSWFFFFSWNDAAHWDRRSPSSCKVFLPFTEVATGFEQDKPWLKLMVGPIGKSDWVVLERLKPTNPDTLLPIGLSSISSEMSKSHLVFLFPLVLFDPVGSLSPLFVSNESTVLAFLNEWWNSGLRLVLLFWPALGPFLFRETTIQGPKVASCDSTSCTSGGGEAWASLSTTLVVFSVVAGGEGGLMKYWQLSCRWPRRPHR